MSIRRTKHDKIAAQLHREKMEYRFRMSEDTEQHTSLAAVTGVRHQKKNAIFGYDIKLIYGDLLKTVLFALTIITSIIVLGSQFNR